METRILFLLVVLFSTELHAGVWVSSDSPIPLNRVVTNFKRDNGMKMELSKPRAGLWVSADGPIPDGYVAVARKEKPISGYKVDKFFFVKLAKVSRKKMVIVAGRIPDDFAVTALQQKGLTLYYTIRPAKSGLWALASHIPDGYVSTETRMKRRGNSNWRDKFSRIKLLD